MTKNTFTLFLFFFLAKTLFSQGKIEKKAITIGENISFFSTTLNEKRQLNVYLPEGFNAKDSTRYHVIYLLDGSADEDFLHTVGLVQFNTFSWIEQLPPTIVVGIGNVDRKRDFTFPTTIESDKKRFPSTGGSQRFMDFLEKEVQPFIATNYPVSQEKTIVGQSLGGLLATEILLKRPLLFNRYIIISPSIWWDNGSLLKENSSILEESFAQKTDIYIGVGKEGLAPCETPHVMEVDANLLAEKIKASKSKKTNTYFDYLPAETHATITHQAVFNAFRLIFGKK